MELTAYRKLSFDMIENIHRSRGKKKTIVHTLEHYDQLNQPQDWKL